jgi:hypothetical protein
MISESISSCVDLLKSNFEIISLLLVNFSN